MKLKDWPEWKWFAVVGFVLGFVSAVISIVQVFLPADATPIDTLTAAAVGFFVVALLFLSSAIYRLRKAWIELTNSCRHLDVIRLSLPELFLKTQHLREHLSSERLEALFQELREHVDEIRSSNPGAFIGLHPDNDFDYKDLLDGLNSQFVINAAKDLLRDLRAGIGKLSPATTLTCSIKVLNDGVSIEDAKDGLIPLKSHYHEMPNDAHVRGEAAYLAGGASLAARVLDRRVMISFGEFDQVYRDHRAGDWEDPEDPDNRMSQHIKSGVLCAIADNGTATSVLQIDSPEENAFGEEVADMVKCTANALGVLFSVVSYVRLLFAQLVWQESINDNAIESARAEKQKRIALEKQLESQRSELENLKKKR